MPSVLFVCTANICRSPMAAALFKHKLDKDGQLEKWRVESAGTWARDGYQAATTSQDLLEKQGLSLKEHLSRSITTKLMGQFNLILTMERGQKEALRVEFPEVGDRIFLLTEMIGDCRDIKDPIGGPEEDYQKTIQEIEDILEKGYPRILQLANRESRDRE
jgi:protein-tyrosine phosphatase